MPDISAIYGLIIGISALILFYIIMRVSITRRKIKESNDFKIKGTGVKKHE
jgi:H+/gluconate symporter-like permease